MNDRETIITRCAAAAKRMRVNSLNMAFWAGESGAHLGGTLSMIEIMAVLYGGVLRFRADDPLWEQRDRFILSKGHGVLAQYVAMYEAGLLPEEELRTFKADGSFLSGHPSMNLARGIEFSSGSLGQGLSLGVGTCLALRRKGNADSRAFVLLGDGECDEGSVWEAAAAAASFGLSNLVAIVDKNGLQYDGPTQEVLNMDSLLEKWKSFGWQAVELDGHDPALLYDALQTRPAGRPLAVVADTVKGKGVSFMENQPQWHHARLTQQQLQQALQELGEEC